jgi:hypothetical protein
MIKELENLLPSIPLLLENEEAWGTLLINKYPPTIHRAFLKLSDDRILLLHKLFNTQHEHALMHSHSWPFACKVIMGGYEMGVGFSEDRNQPPQSVFTSVIKTGDIYEMLSPDVWHYTKPAENTEYSYSIMLIGKRCRERKAENNSPLFTTQKNELFSWFKAYYEILNK